MAKTLTDAKRQKLEARRNHMKHIIESADAIKEIEMNKIGYWSILNGEVGIEDAMYIMGGDKNNIDNTINMLKKHDTNDGSQSLAIQLALAHSCYMRLVSIGEILPDTVWNFKKRDYSHRVISNVYDYGFDGPKCYIFNKNNEWERVNQ